MTILDLLIGQVSPQSSADSFATVTSVGQNGVTLRFDGGSGTSKTYKCNSSAVFHVGDRVKVDKDSGTYVAAYPVGGPKQDDDTHGIPAGGSAGQALVKINGTDYNVQWAAIHQLPAGGSTGQVLSKVNATDYNVQWTTPESIPSGGSTGQVLTKKSTGPAWDDAPKEIPTGGSDGQVLTKDGSSSGVVKWAAAPGLPSGGSTGQVLTKNASGAGWADVPKELPTGGTSGQVLTKNSSANYDVKWSAAPEAVTNQLKNGNYTLTLNASGNLQPPQGNTYKVSIASLTYPIKEAHVQDLTTYGGTQIGGTKTNVTAKLGFFGKTPIARQTLSSSATLAQVITALKNYGLFN